MALTNSQYDAIMREYNRKQAKDRYEQEQRIKEVYGAIGQMEDLEKEISSLAVSQAKKLLEGEKQALTALREKMCIRDRCLSDGLYLPLCAGQRMPSVCFGTDAGYRCGAYSH